MQETSCQTEAHITDLLERARKLRQAGERLIQEADSLWMLARNARQANIEVPTNIVSMPRA